MTRQWPWMKQQAPLNESRWPSKVTGGLPNPHLRCTSQPADAADTAGHGHLLRTLGCAGIHRDQQTAPGSQVRRGEAPALPPPNMGLIKLGWACCHALWASPSCTCKCRGSTFIQAVDWSICPCTAPNPRDRALGPTLLLVSSPEESTLRQSLPSLRDWPTTAVSTPAQAVPFPALGWQLPALRAAASQALACPAWLEVGGVVEDGRGGGMLMTRLAAPCAEPLPYPGRPASTACPMHHPSGIPRRGRQQPPPPRHTPSPRRPGCTQRATRTSPSRAWAEIGPSTPPMRCSRASCAPRGTCCGSAPPTRRPLAAAWRRGRRTARRRCCWRSNARAPRSPRRACTARCAARSGSPTWP